MHVHVDWFLERVHHALFIINGPAVQNGSLSSWDHVNTHFNLTLEVVSRTVKMAVIFRDYSSAVKSEIILLVLYKVWPVGDSALHSLFLDLTAG